MGQVAITHTFTFKNCEFEVDVTANIYEAYGSNVFIEDFEFTNPATGKYVSNRLHNFLIRNYEDAIADRVIDTLI